MNKLEYDIEVDENDDFDIQCDDIIVEMDSVELENLKASICDKLCRFPYECSDFDQMLDEKCSICVLNRLKGCDE